MLFLDADGVLYFWERLGVVCFEECALDTGL